MTGRYIYAGMAGRNLTTTSLVNQAATRAKRAKGLRDRLGAHKLGARSGDQFCIYACSTFLSCQRSALMTLRKWRRGNDGSMTTSVATSPRTSATDGS